MAKTNFAALLDEQKTVWSRDVWKAARNASFVDKFTGRGHNAMITRVTELTKDEKGARAVISLVADLEGDGVAGDNELEGNEEAIKAYDQVIQIDQLRHANENKGRMSDQRTVIKFRGQSKDVLAYWLADRLDQMAFLTMSGVSYAKHNNGKDRNSNSQLVDLDFAADVTAPSANRHRRWDAANGLVAGDTTAVDPADTPSYKMLVEMKAYAKDQYIRGIRGTGNMEYFHVFMTPSGMAKLKLDSDYLANLRNAGPRGNSNSLFSGSVVTQDGLIIHEFRHVYNTKGATSGTGKWGAGADVDGQRVLMCGAQALGLADLGAPYWVEKGKDYENRQAISVGKMLGLLKPAFMSQVNGTVEDFGVLCVDTAI